jgi:CRP-like cAMP-binding protein
MQLSTRLLSAHNKLIDFAIKTNTQRVINTIQVLSLENGQNLDYSDREIADMSRTTIETVSRVFRRLKKLAIIQIRRGHIDIPDPKGFKL